MDLKKIEAAYKQALPLLGSARESYLQRLRSEDPELASEVEALLKTGSIDDAILRGPIGASAARLSEEVKDPWLGRELGGYRVVERIAAGGMGVVYLAERSDDEFEHTVAIKFLTTGLATETLKSRFLSERQILAQLNHPNVARLLDGGTTDVGVPYLVMEFIEGLPVDEYCEQNQLDTRQRLRLFQKICAAVQYAHQSLVIHRDIKASNILVGADGEPKLLDFGIAKLTDPENPGLTQADMRMLTPESASPEQISGDPVSTATDVYALGLLLYRLLTGHFPYSIVSDTAKDIYHAILETDPERPSNVVSPNNPERSDIDVRRLRKELVGDLDTIILTALRKEPERRYGTVRQFSEDIDNYLYNRPVMTRRDSVSYRTGKFLQRHRLGVAMAAAVFTLVTFYTFRLAEERDIAQQERDTAEQVSSFIVDVFRVSDPSESRGNTITAREILDRSTEDLEQGLADQPVVKARLSSVLSEVHFGLGLYPQASELAARAVELHGEHVGSESRALARYQEILGNAQHYLGELEAARSQFETVLAIRNRVLGPNHPETLNVEANLGGVLFALGDVQASADVCQEALPRALLIEDIAVKTLVMLCHAEAQNHLNNYAEAESLVREAAALQLAAWGPDDVTYIETLQVLSGMISVKGEEAMTLLNTVVDTLERVFGSEHRLVLEAVMNRGFKHQGMQNFEAAMADADRALALIGRGIDDNGVWEAHALRLKALSLSDSGRYREAEHFHRRTIEVGSIGRKGPSALLIGAKSALVTTSIVLGKFDQAMRYALEAREESEQLFGKEHPRSVLVMRGLGDIATHQNDNETALSYYDEGLRRAIATGNQRVTATMQLSKGLVLKEERPAEALVFVNEVRAPMVEYFGESSAHAGALWWIQGAAERNLGQTETGIEHGLLSVDIIRKSMGNAHPWVHRSSLDLAKTYAAAGKLDKARELAEVAVAGFETTYAAQHPTTVNAHAFLHSISR